MSRKSERPEAREAVAAYHETCLSELVGHVGRAIDGFRAGELDAFETDRALFQYSRSAKELWKFCNLLDVDAVARDIADGPAIDWWERGAPKRL